MIFAASIGDSVTFAQGGGGLVAAEHYPYHVQQALIAAGARGDLRILNLGISGNTTGQMVARRTVLLNKGVPAFATIKGGINDASKDTTVASGSSSTVFDVQAGHGGDFKAGSYCKVNGVSRQILSVSTDTITLTTALGGTPTAGQTVTIDTQANIENLIDYLQAAGCTRIAVIGEHFMNWSTGGDTVATPNATYAALRVLQAAAATAKAVPFVDTHAYFKALIVAATYTEGDWASWHYADVNVHLSANGQSLLANPVVTAIVGAGWLTAIT